MSETEAADPFTAVELNEILENAPYDVMRGRIFELPDHSLRAEQPLFPHQAQTLAAFEANGESAGIVHLPTGAGKTRVAIEIMARRLKKDPRERFLWATYPRLLIRQGMARVAEMASLFPRGTNIAWAMPRQCLDHKEILEEVHVTFLMRDDLADLLADAGDRRVKEPPLLSAFEGRLPLGCPRVTVIYDECHQLGAEGLQRAWHKFERQVPPELRSRFQTVGFSATPLPTDRERHSLLKRTVFPVGHAVTRKPDWGMLVHASVENRELVSKEILCPINLDIQESGLFDIPEALLRAAGADGLRSPGRDPSKNDLREFADRFNNKVLTHDGILRFLAGRLAKNYRSSLGKTLVFVPTIDAANRLTQYLRVEAGSGDITMVHSKLDEFSDAMLDDDDASVLEVQRQTAAFRARGDSPCIMVNVGMLTTGFDDPKIRTVLLARLTFSTNLFWQMIGRGSRGLRCGGTRNCFVIDPIRLTDKFRFLEGYRPQFDRSQEDSTKLASLTSEADMSSALDPHIPTVSCAGINPAVLPTISSALAQDLAEALRAFLQGGPVDPRVANEVAVRTTVEGELVHHEFVAVDRSAATPPSVDPGWMPELAVDRLQAEFRLEDGQVDLSWLKTAQHMPPTTSDIDFKVFQGKLEMVRRHKVKTKLDFERLLLEALSRA